MNEAIRLKKVREEVAKLSQSKFAEELNVSQSRIRDIELSKQKISVELAQAVEKIYMIDFKWLLTGEGQMFIDSEKQEIDSTEIPQKGEVECSAGAGCHIYNEEITGYLSFENRLLKQLGANIPYCDVLTVNGDSMHPTLENGDKILVDKSKKEVIDGKIYILRIEDRVKVKKLQKLPKGKLRVISENKEYEPFDLTPKEDDFEICGRVLWSGRIYI